MIGVFVFCSFKYRLGALKGFCKPSPFHISFMASLLVGIDGTFREVVGASASCKFLSIMTFKSRELGVYLTNNQGSPSQPTSQVN